MPFLARCPECDHAQVCVLDPVSEPRLRCGRCRTYYTAREPALVPAVTEQPESEGATPASVAVLDVGSPPTVPVADPVVELGQPILPATAPPAGRWAVPLTTISLVLLAGALFTAPFEALSVLVRPLAGVSLLTGLAAIWSSRLAGRRLRYPAAVTATAAVVLLAALAAPAVLGPAYEAAREPPPPDPDIRVVPQPGYAHETDVGTEWVDARRATLQQGRVRVEVPEAWTGPAAKKEGREKGGTWLYVRVRLYRARTGSEIAAGAFAQSLEWNDQARATVRDTAGNAFEQLPYRPPAAKAGGASSASGVSLDVSDEVLTFPAPVSLAGGLRLELAGAAWGGTGSFRFALPADMIQDRSPRPGKTRGG